MRRLLILSVLWLPAGCTTSQATEAWLRQLKDPEVVKRRQAVRELGCRIAEAELIMPALSDALRDVNGYVRHDAAVTLGKFGPAARAAIPALAAALRDKERTVRKAAAQALKKIDSQGAPRSGEL